MNMKARLFFAALVATTTMAGVSNASVDERYAELQMVPEAINDPDPLMRLAQLEAIIAEGDATKVQLALRTAFTVDDPNIRSLALRAHFAKYDTVVIDAEYPEGLEEALKRGAEDRKLVATALVLDGVGRQFSLLTRYESLSQVEMPFISLNNNPNRDERISGSGNIRGTTITFAGEIRFSGGNSTTCSFELSRYEGFVVHGFGSCNRPEGTVPFPVSLRLF